jgi:hypothetical protein
MWVRRLASLTWPWAIAAAGLALLVAGVTGAMSQSAFNVVTASLQAVGVVLALGLGAATLRRDSHDRRVDRVLALNQELMSGELWHARQRLAEHFKTLRAGPADAFGVVTRDQLFGDPAIGKYASAEGVPGEDVDRLVRFFERANSALATRAVEPDLFAQLIGRHANWWDHAIAYDPNWTTRIPLAELSTWFVRIQVVARTGGVQGLPVMA